MLHETNPYAQPTDSKRIMLIEENAWISDFTVPTNVGMSRNRFSNAYSGFKPIRPHRGRIQLRMNDSTDI